MIADPDLVPAAVHEQRVGEAGLLGALERARVRAERQEPGRSGQHLREAGARLAFVGGFAQLEKRRSQLVKSHVNPLPVLWCTS